MKRFKAIILLSIAIFVVLSPVVITMSVYAAEIRGLEVYNAKQDEIYNRLLESAYTHHVASVLKWCFKNNADVLEPKEYNISESMYRQKAKFASGSQVLKGDIFNQSKWDFEDKTKAVTLWLEHLVEPSRNDRDGITRCSEGGDSGIGIMMQFLKLLNADPNGDSSERAHFDTIMCGDDNRGGLLQRYEEKYEWEWWWAIFGIEGNYKYTPVYDSCNQYDGKYAIKPNWSAILKDYWGKYISGETNVNTNGNKYMYPDWDKIQSENDAYNNIDGYFNYIEDFEFNCNSKARGWTTDPGSGYSTTKIRTYTKQSGQNDPYIKVKSMWYHVNDTNENWREWVAGEDPDGQQATCTDVLHGIDRVATQWNGVTIDVPLDEREAGFEQILLAELNIVCKDRKVVNAPNPEDEGKNIYEVMRVKYQEWLANPPSDATEEEIAEVQASLDKINAAYESAETNPPGRWIEDDSEDGGDPDAERGLKYFCLKLANVQGEEEVYDPPAIHIGDDVADNNCYEKSGSLGWILCPIITTAREAIIKAYGGIVEPALKMDTALFQAGHSKKNGTYNAWSIFLQFGNAAFVILFVFIIFSQITGLGIDNYGVKKALPKALLAAVLINMSFILCQGAIDLSNIVGQGVGGLFQSISVSIVQYPTEVSVSVGDQTTTVHSTDTGSWKDTRTWGASFRSNLLGNSAIVILVAALGIGAVLSQGLAILIPIFMMIISLLIAILTLVAILGIRQALAVLLVVLSPLAFACYILPNTKKLYEKWFKTFQGLLVAYPVCSALVYGGDMVANILLNVANQNVEGNLWILISAAVVSVAPIFIIPGMIKKSMGAISGGIAALSARGGNFLKGKASNRLNKSALANRRDFNRNMRAQKHNASASAYNAKRGKAYIESDRVKNKLKSGKSLSDRQRRRYNVAMGAVNAENESAVDAYTSSFAGLSDGEIETRLLASVKDGQATDANMIVAGLASIHDEDKLTHAVRALADTGALDHMNRTDNANYKRVAGVLQSREDSVINQSMGKLMNQDVNVGEMWAGGRKSKLADKVHSAGLSGMATQNKDVFATEGARDLFSDEQLATIIGSNPTGGKAANIQQMMSGDTEESMGAVIQKMKTSHLGELNTANFSGKNGDVAGTLGILGGGDASVGAARVQKYNPGGLAQLGNGDSREIRADMDRGAAALLSSAAAAAGGGGGGGTPAAPAPAAPAPAGPDPAAPDAPAPDAPAPAPTDSVDIPIDRSLNTDDAPIEGDIEISHAHPTAPDLHSIEDTGTRRDASGQVVGKRAAEGNKFDYYPRQAGETASDYSSRAEWQREAAEWGARQAPQGEHEKIEDYHKRMQPISYEKWKAAGGGKMK